MKTFTLITAVLLFQIQIVTAQEVKIPEIGSKAPSFTAMSTNGEINFPKDYGDHWKIILSHPKDFTPVCSSEILELAYDQESFEELNTKIVVVSTDIMPQHESWKKSLEEINYKDRGTVKINFPLVSDNDLKVSKEYGMLHSSTSVSKNIRGVYIIDPDNVVRLVLFYPNEVGRNIDELKRSLIALQTLGEESNRVSPANWNPGDDLIAPVLSKEDKVNIGNTGSNYYQYSWYLTFAKQK